MELPNLREEVNHRIRSKEAEARSGLQVSLVETLRQYPYFVTENVVSNEFQVSVKRLMPSFEAYLVAVFDAWAKECLNLSSDSHELEEILRGPLIAHLLLTVYPDPHAQDPQDSPGHFEGTQAKWMSC